MSNELGLNLDARLELVRQTDCKPFDVVGVIQFVTSREEFYKLVRKFIDQSKDKEMKFDKMLVFGEFKGVSYYRIILIKYKQEENEQAK